MMKHTFLLKYLLGMLLCGAHQLIGMDGAQVDAPDQLKQNLTASQGNLLAFNALKKQHADEIALLKNKYKREIKEHTESLEASRKQEAMLRVLNTDLRQQLEQTNQSATEFLQEKEKLLQENAALLLKNKLSEENRVRAEEERSKEISDIFGQHQEILLAKDTELTDLTAERNKEQGLHQDASEKLTKVQSAYANALFYKKLFFAAFLACAIAFAGHVLYVHHGFTALS